MARLDSAELGNFGDCAAVGNSVSEMRIHVGPGYRVYFTQSGATYLLLTGGQKRSQKRDIERAKKIARALKERGQ
jgi:putative addiction module killer protein